MLKLLGHPRSRAFRVLWALEELGLDYEHAPVLPHSPEVRALNPSGKIPVLMAGDAVLTDSTAILSYLADAHGALTHPCGTIERARQDALTHRVLDEIDATLWMAARHSFVLPPESRVPDIKASLKRDFAASVRALGDEMAGPFACGATMTVADIVLTHCLGWARIAGFAHDSAPMAAYHERMRARPAYGRASRR